MVLPRGPSRVGGPCKPHLRDDSRVSLGQAVGDPRLLRRIVPPWVWRCKFEWCWFSSQLGVVISSCVGLKPTLLAITALETNTTRNHDAEAAPETYITRDLGAIRARLATRRRRWRPARRLGSWRPTCARARRRIRILDRGDTCRLAG